MARCVLIRPGETDYDRQGRVSGALDLPLNQNGSDEVARLVPDVRAQSPEIVYTGPRDPALSTARAIAADLDVSVKELDGLEGVDQGLWQGLLVEDIRRKQPKLFKQWQESPGSVTPPDGEDCDDVTERVAKALKKPLKKHRVFAVVAAEPLATLVARVVAGEAPELGGPAEPLDEDGEPRTLMEIVETPE